MPSLLKRTNIVFNPDASRVIARYFTPGGDKTIIETLNRVIDLDEKEAQFVLNQILREFSHRHRNVTNIYRDHFRKLRHFNKLTKVDLKSLSDIKKLLIGAYFTSEYSIESAAFFNPSIIEDPDQSHLNKGEKRIIVSFRATGEGHISSIVFRNGIIDNDNNIVFDKAHRLVEEPHIVKDTSHNKDVFKKKLLEMNVQEDVLSPVLKRLGDNFTFEELIRSVDETKNELTDSYECRQELESIKWLAGSHYKMQFSMDTAISERVIFPIHESESNGIEDARFVKFTDDDGEITYYATYTAYNGFAILPKLLMTKDFYNFEVLPLYGEYAHNKGMALFPRKINGQFVMLSRLDGTNNYVMFSDEINVWQKAIKIQEPEFTWEFVKIGNSGSPIETERGWLVLTHAVGPMRQYSIGAMLLDLADPTKVLGKMAVPLISPNEDEREGYVPNVVYSCGAIRNDKHLIITYATSDSASSIATVNIESLVDRIIEDSNNGSKIEKKDANILYVEDDTLYLRFISGLLKAEGYNVSTASDGVDAILELAKGNFDLVISDINMPNFNGLQLLEKMNIENVKTPVIFLSGDSNSELISKGKELGALDFLKKPIDRALLMKKVEFHINGKLKKV